MWFWHSRMLKRGRGGRDDPRARATRGLRRMRRERPGALLARRTRTMKRCSSDARSRGQPWPLPNRDMVNWKALARANGTSRRASGWAGAKVARNWDHPTHLLVVSDRFLWPCPRNGACWRAGVGWVRSLNFLSILLDSVFSSMTRAVGAHPPVSSAVIGGGSSEKASRSFVNMIVLSVLALIILSGCALFAPREEVRLKQATVEELTALLSQREAAIQTMKGLFSAKVRGGIIPIASRVEGTLYYRRPNAMRLRGFTAVGGELFEFVQVDDQFRLRLPTMGRVLSGSPSDMSEMGKLARPFQLSVWAMGGVLGTGTIAKDETVTLVEEGDRYRLEVFGPSPGGAQFMRRRLWFERQALHVVREDRLTESGAVEATIQYEDFRAIGEAEAVSSDGNRQLLRPFKILLEDGKGQGSVEVTFHEMTPNQSLKATDLGQV